MTWIHPSEKLRALKQKSARTHRGLVWVVVYVNQRNSSKGPSRGVSVDQLCSEVLSDSAAAFEGGADGVVLIDEWADRCELEACVKAVRSRYSDELLGVNYLGSTDDPYGYRGAFDIAKQNSLDWVWTDFSGVDLIQEQPEVSLHAIEEARRKNFEHGFYASGIHMKYSTLLDASKSLEQSAFQAMGFVDGIVLTGSKTGMPTDPDAVARVKTVVGTYPVGVASGLTYENAPALLSAGAQFFMVASSLQNSEKRIELKKVTQLISAMSR